MDKSQERKTTSLHRKRRKREQQDVGANIRWGEESGVWGYRMVETIWKKDIFQFMVYATDKSIFHHDIKFSTAAKIKHKKRSERCEHHRFTSELKTANSSPRGS